VIVVGLGQVGVRLCEALRAQGTSVVGVERDRNAVGVRLARELGIPVVIGDGSERALLERVRVSRCLALAAVGSDDLDNLAVAVATAAVSPSTRVVLRAGEQEAVAETRSLLPLGVIRDVTKIGATFVVATTLGRDARAVVSDGDTVFLRTAGSEYVPFRVSGKDQCRHTAVRHAAAH
jgi:Trk K+ transport system NAD-binding subunit